MEEKLITTKELCEWQRISKSTVFRWRVEGMPYYGTDRSLRYKKSEVTKWLENKTGKNTVTFEDKEIYNYYIELTKNLSTHQCEFYLNVFEIIKTTMNLTKDRKFSFNRSKVMDSLDIAKNEFNKIINMECNFKLLNSTLINIFESLDCCFDVELIENILNYINYFIGTNLNDLDENSRVKKLEQFYYKLEGFNENYSFFEQYYEFILIQKINKKKGSGSDASDKE